METLFLQVLNMSMTGSYVILAVLVMRFLLKWAPKKYSYTLWLVAAFRLVCPVSIRSVFSIFAFLPERSAEVASSVGSTITYIPSDIGFAAVPEVSTGIPILSDAVNRILPAATPMASVNPIQVWIFLGTVIWCVGIAMMLGWAVVSMLLLRKRVEKATLREKGIFECENVKSPFILGIFAPKIYIPHNLEPEQLRYILAHERCHIRKGDHITKFIAYCILALHWFNPLCWLAYYLMGKDMEMRCDEHVLSRSGTLSWEYSYSLLSIATNRRFSPAGPLAFGESSVKTRIKNILQWKKPRFWVSIFAIVLCIGCFVVCLVNPVVDSTDRINYVTEEEIYCYRSSDKIGPDDGYRYILDEDSITQIHRKTGEVILDKKFDRLWEAFPYDDDTWNGMIFWATVNAGMSVDFPRNGSGVSFRYIDEVSFLLYLEGTLYICRQEIQPDGEPIILTIYSLKPENSTPAAASDNKDEIPVMKYARIPVDTILWRRRSLQGSSFEWFGDGSYTMDDWHDDAKLQQAASRIAIEYPLDSLEELNDYAWALYDYFMDNKVFGPELVPDWIEHYAEGIWEISFSPHFDGMVYYDGPSATALVSEEDGHIIFFTPEPRFMTVNTVPLREENYYVWEPWETLSDIWWDADTFMGNKEEWDFIADFDAFELDGRYGNEVVQAHAAAVFAEFPLNTQYNIQSYAWGLHEILVEEGIIQEDMVAESAHGYYDSVWRFYFSNGGSDENTKFVYVYVSDKDGRVIHIQ